MSRIKTDLKPTVKSIASLTSTSPKKNDSFTKLPPVSIRSSSACSRSNVDLKWTVDMVRGFTIQGSSKENDRAKAVGSNLSNTTNRETYRTNRDYEKLYQKYLSSQKMVSQLREEIKAQEKTISKLQEKLSRNEAEYEQNLQRQGDIITQHECKIERFYEQIKELKDVIMARTNEMDRTKKEVEDTRKECDEKVKFIMQKTDAQINALCHAHKEELANRDSKLSFLKMQLESALKNNSRERQRQLDELTRELARVTDETEVLKTKLRALAKQKEHDKCRNCAALGETLESKLKELRAKDNSIAELLQHCEKMAVQLSRQDEFFQLCEQANVKDHYK